MAKFTILLLNLFTFILELQSNLAFTTSSPETLISTTSKDQIACTVCVSCQNPCQPVPSPPTAVLPPLPSPPSAPPPSCTVCGSCQNPCQPVPSPPTAVLPPPPSPPSSPPPSPPVLPECPPPISPPAEYPPPPASPKNCSACTPWPNVTQLSPPRTPMPFPPPSGEFALPGNAALNFPNYYNPPPSPEASDSANLVLKFINISSVLLLLSLLCCF